MKQLIYYVAASLDGFISGANEDISGFVQEGNGVQKYLEDLKAFKTVIMGRKTYEFGYEYGLKPGQPAYAHMDHFIFSDHMTFENPHDKVKVKPIDINEIKEIRKNSETDIYVCGGGQFAGWLLEHEEIDIMKLKINPLILGDGIRLFGDSTKKHLLKLLDSELFEGGLLINTYRIRY